MDSPHHSFRVGIMGIPPTDRELFCFPTSSTAAPHEGGSRGSSPSAVVPPPIRTPSKPRIANSLSTRNKASQRLSFSKKIASRSGGKGADIEKLGVKNCPPKTRLDSEPVRNWGKRAQPNLLRSSRPAPLAVQYSSPELKELHDSGPPKLRRFQSPEALMVPAPTPGRAKTSQASRANTGKLAMHSEPPPWLGAWHPNSRMLHPMAVDAVEQVSWLIADAAYRLAPELEYPTFVHYVRDTLTAHILHRFEMTPVGSAETEPAGFSHEFGGSDSSSLDSLSPTAAVHSTVGNASVPSPGLSALEARQQPGKRSVQFSSPPLDEASDNSLAPKRTCILKVPPRHTTKAISTDADGRRRFNSAIATELIPLNSIQVTERKLHRAFSTTVAYLQAAGGIPKNKGIPEHHDTGFFFRALDFLSAEGDPNPDERGIGREADSEPQGLGRQKTADFADGKDSEIDTDRSHRESARIERGPSSPEDAVKNRTFPPSMMDSFDEGESSQQLRSGSVACVKPDVPPSRIRQASMPFPTPGAARRPTSSGLGDILTAAILAEQHMARRQDTRSDSLATAGPYSVHSDMATTSSSLLLTNSNQSNSTPSQELTEFIHRALRHASPEDSGGGASAEGGFPSDLLRRKAITELTGEGEGDFHNAPTLDNPDVPVTLRRASDVYVRNAAQQKEGASFRSPAPASTTSSKRQLRNGNVADAAVSHLPSQLSPNLPLNSNASLLISAASTAEPFASGTNFSSDIYGNDPSALGIQEAILQGQYLPGAPRSAIVPGNAFGGQGLPFVAAPVDSASISANGRSKPQQMYQQSPMSLLPAPQSAHSSSHESKHTTGHFSSQPAAANLFRSPPSTPPQGYATGGAARPLGSNGGASMAVARDSAILAAIPVVPPTERAPNFYHPMYPPRPTGFPLNGAAPSHQQGPSDSMAALGPRPPPSWMRRRLPEPAYGFRYPSPETSPPPSSLNQRSPHFQPFQMAAPVTRVQDGTASYATLQQVLPPPAMELSPSNGGLHPFPAGQYLQYSPAGNQETYADDHDRMIFVSWIPKQSRAYNSSEKRRDELILKARLRENLKIQGVAKVLLFPPKGAHCKLIFQTRALAATFMERYGGDNGSILTEQWKVDICGAFGIQLTEKFDQTVVKIEWAQR